MFSLIIVAKRITNCKRSNFPASTIQHIPTIIIEIKVSIANFFTQML